MALFNDDERDRLLLALVIQAQRNYRPMGNDATKCIVCGAIIGWPVSESHRENCAYVKGCEGITQRAKLH